MRQPDGQKLPATAKLRKREVEKVLDDVEEVLDDVEEVPDDVEEVLDDVEEVLDDVEEVLDDVEEVLDDVEEVRNDVPEMPKPSKSLKNEEIGLNFLKNGGRAQAPPTGCNTSKTKPRKIKINRGDAKF